MVRAHWRLERKHWMLIGAAILVLLIVVLSGVLRSPVVLTLAMKPPADCGGVLTYDVSLTKTNGEGIAGQWVTVSANGNLWERLRTDQNGRFSSTKDTPKEWCDHDLTLTAAYDGATFHENASATQYALIKKTTCPDGTSIGRCTAQPGVYCAKNATLIIDCMTCGCPAGLVCDQNACITDEERTAALVWSLQQSVVKIEDENAMTGGSGVIIAGNEEQTVIITNRHVIENADKPSDLIITTIDGKTAPARTIRIAPDEIDLAIITINGQYGTPAHINNSQPYATGQHVLALGSPGLLTGELLQGSVSNGIISNDLRFQTETGTTYDVIQTDAAINPGNSGGGLFLTPAGRLIGINTWTATAKQGINFAITITTLNDLPGYEDWDRFQPIKKCADRTPYGQCSTNSPSYACNNGRLTPDCESCGCPTDGYCQDNGECFGCNAGYEPHLTDDGEGFCCRNGYNAYSDGTCCPPAYNSYITPSGTSFCCPHGTQGTQQGTCI